MMMGTLYDGRDALNIRYLKDLFECYMCLYVSVCVHVWYPPEALGALEEDLQTALSCPS